MRCDIEALGRWADAAPTASFSGLTAARVGLVALVLTSQGGTTSTALPFLDGGTRYWGDGLRVPVGYAAVPRLSERVTRRALGIPDDAVAVLDGSGLELVPRSVFRPLTRAGVRLARGEGTDRFTR